MLFCGLIHSLVSLSTMSSRASSFEGKGTFVSRGFPAGKHRDSGQKQLQYIPQQRTKWVLWTVIILWLLPMTVWFKYTQIDLLLFVNWLFAPSLLIQSNLFNAVMHKKRFIIIIIFNSKISQKFSIYINVLTLFVTFTHLYTSQTILAQYYNIMHVPPLWIYSNNLQEEI